MDSIGDILKRERSERGLSLHDVHDSTKIMVQNISALEENRFEYFPNRVYARAFLRDYSNFLGLDSAALLARYEDEWNIAKKPEVVPVAKSGSIWKSISYTLLIIVLLGCLGTAAYFGWAKYEKKSKASRTPVSLNRNKPQDDNVAHLPTVTPVAPPKEIKNLGENGKPIEKPAQPAVPDKLALNVAAYTDVWVRVTADDQKVFEGILTKGQAKDFVGKKIVTIRSGKAGGVQVKLNGQIQPPMGPLGAPGEKTYTLPASTPTAASGSNGTPAPGTPAR